MCILSSYLSTTTTGQIAGGARSEAILDLRLGFNGKSYAGDEFWRFDLDGNAVPLSVNVLLEFGKCIG